MGDNNVVREGVTINAGTAGGGGKTVVGDNNFFMACAHVAHDCIIEDNVLLANGVLLGGHIMIERGAQVDGACWYTAFCDHWTICLCGRSYPVVQDVPPYVIIEGHPAKIRQVNVVGLEREGFSKEQIDEIKRHFWHYFVLTN